MGLIKITTTPIEYEIKIEKAKLKVKEQDYMESDEKVKQLTRQKQMADNKLIANPRAVNQAAKASDEYQNLARQRSASVMKATAVNNAAVPQAAAAVAEQQNIAAVEYVSQTENISVQNDYEYFNLDNSSADSMYTTSFSLNLSSSKEWNVAKNEMEYVPGRFKMEITQFPEVKIEYTGGFMYVPPSSDPEYDEENK